MIPFQHRRISRDVGPDSVKPEKVQSASCRRRRRYHRRHHFLSEFFIFSSSSSCISGGKEEPNARMFDEIENLNLLRS